MSRRKPFSADPVVLGPYWRAEQKRARRNRVLHRLGLIALVSSAVFVTGMAVTNWTALSARLPTYYSSCAVARAAGAAPIRRGSPGYRSKLDADGDGIACEPYRHF